MKSTGEMINPVKPVAFARAKIIIRVMVVPIITETVGRYLRMIYCLSVDVATSFSVVTTPPDRWQTVYGGRVLTMVSLKP